jgi:hypothetical protein
MGINFGRSLPNFAFTMFRRLCLLVSNDGQGLMKDDGGLPTWCAGGSDDWGNKDTTGVTETIVATFF